ncbi:lantibiotic dehydratase [Arcicella rosea]|uniref:Thiopeptide-type bacteriocin biosynthesis protein n=1 Tax=Arcicella rosea TaxID=502909 RepID=A0A841ESS5_9BACT|nr:lantibiotic dehydratase [Arcicella rosea]MBB6005374.1 thiopeptide-type bacteriocin biosynthesis protein [Arcicella rosea]
MSNSYQFLKKIIVRTPTLPFADDISEDFLKKILNHPPFLEALYLASPILFNEAQLWKDGNITNVKKAQKIVFSLSKYYSRMCSRCTPFGLFAGCSVVEWSDETALTIASEKRRSTRLDMHYAGALAQSLSEIPFIKSHLLYFPNSSIYQIGQEIRYVEYKYVDGKRTHQISAFEWSEYIALVLDACKKGAKMSDIAPLLIDDDISEEDALGFIEQLVDAQLLINELEPAITGEGLTQQIIKVLQKINVDEHYLDTLQSIENQLKAIDSQQINEISIYQEITKLITKIGVPFEEGKLFQTDLVNLFHENKLSSVYQEALSEIAELLIQVSEKRENPTQSDFIQKFYERYENQEIPLLIVMDTETGIGYGQTGKSNFTPIANGFELNHEKKEEITVKLNAFQQHLYGKYLNALKENALQVNLNEDDFKPFLQKKDKTPSSTSMIFRLTGDEELPIYLEKLGGTSAVNLLGRFAHTDKAILDIIQEITEKEQALNPEVVFAEIVHLPENRIGNILLHPAFWKYEIPYLAKSSLPENQQILLEDLLVSVDISQQKIRLKSKRLNKEVIPRLSNAHNYSMNALPIYHFLCDLQSANLVVAFDTGWRKVTQNTRFSPRLTYKNIILEAATWQFKKEDFEHLLINSPENLLVIFHEFSVKWQLPKRFVLVDFDNELLVNTENLLSIQTWLDAIKNRDKIELKEFLFTPNNGHIVNQSGAFFTNQFIASLINKKTIFEQIPAQKPLNHDIQRTFSLGSEWLYLKIYSGVKAADDILAQNIKSLVEQFLEKQLIDKWFFIRYTDPDNHIRLRLHFTDLKHLGEVILGLKETLDDLEKEGIIWKIQYDTYQREIERYGADVMILTENIFFHDSETIANLLAQTWGDEREHLRWQFAMKLIDTFLDDFGFSLYQKLDLMYLMKENFAQEFHIDKPFKLQMDKRFREYRKNIEMILGSETNEEYALLFESIQQKSKKIKENIEQIKALKSKHTLNKYLSSIIHMTVNRVIANNQRFHELIIYDFMYRFYQAETAKQKKADKM